MTGGSNQINEFFISNRHKKWERAATGVTLVKRLPGSLDLRLRAIAARWGAAATVSWLNDPEAFIASCNGPTEEKPTSKRARSIRAAHDVVLSARRFARPQWLIEAYEYELVEQAGREVEDCEAAVVQALAHLAEAEREFARLWGRRQR